MATVYVCSRCGKTGKDTFVCEGTEKVPHGSFVVSTSEDRKESAREPRAPKAAPKARSRSKAKA